MGSPLGPTISEFYLSYIENRISKTMITKPKIYDRIVDDIFIAIHSFDEINKLKQTLEKNFRWNITTKLIINLKKSLFFMYLPTPPIITNSLHLHIKSQPATIPPYLTTTVNVPRNIK